MANTHKINGKKWRLSGIGLQTWDGEKACVEAGGDNCTSIRWLESG